MRLVDRHPEVDLERLLQSFVPPPRFQSATFATYRPDPRYPSQTLAKERLRRWIKDRPRGFLRPRLPGPQGIYLDGGFGVGKTHLLVAAYWEGAIVLRPAGGYPVEIYSQARIREFLEEDQLTQEERERLAKALGER